MEELSVTTLSRLCTVTCLMCGTKQRAVSCLCGTCYMLKPHCSAHITKVCRMWLYSEDGEWRCVCVSLYRLTQILADSPKHGAQVSIICTMEIRYRAHNCSIIYSHSSRHSWQLSERFLFCCAAGLCNTPTVGRLCNSPIREHWTSLFEKEKSKQSKFAYSVLSLIVCVYEQC